MRQHLPSEEMMDITEGTTGGNGDCHKATEGGAVSKGKSQKCLYHHCDMEQARLRLCGVVDSSLAEGIMRFLLDGGSKKVAEVQAVGIR
jgi:hypothetical protein